MENAYKSLILLVVFIGFAIPPDALAIKMAKATIEVIGEDGLPIEGAEVYIFRDGPGGVATKGTSSKGNTDSNGKYSKTMINYNGYLGYGASKKGYYDSHHIIQLTGVGLGHWTPWNPALKIILRKIENPVPMYARHADIKIPVTNKDIGFDLTKYDWVSPYGAGMSEDMLVNANIDEKGSNDFEYRVIVKFPRKYDGFYEHKEDILRGSSFKLPRLANDGEFVNKEILVGWVGLKRGLKTTWEKDKHYIFRVRSEDEDGKLIRAMYGKIRSDIQLKSNRRAGKLPSLQFIYYLNPDYTPNLEFDPSRNLFGDLRSGEQVSIP